MLLNFKRKQGTKSLNLLGSRTIFILSSTPECIPLAKMAARKISWFPNLFSPRKISGLSIQKEGAITYHGSGQAVLYPVVNLEKAKITVEDFVSGLEEIMKLTAKDFGVKTARNPKNRGLWGGEHKIGSVGLALRKGVSIHGLALNVDPDLTPFSWINPCGIENMSMTSIKKELV